MNPQYKVKNIKHDVRDGRYTLSVFRTIQRFVSTVYFPLDTRLAKQRLLTSLGGTKPFQVPLDQLITPDQIRGVEKDSRYAYRSQVISGRHKLVQSVSRPV